MNRSADRLAAILLLAALDPLVCAAQQPPAPLAIVCRVQGEALLRAGSDGSAPEPLELFDRLRGGERISTGPLSEAELIFLDGERFLLTPSSRAVVARGGLEAESGAVIALEPVPAMAELAPLAGLRGPRQKALAVRLRQDRPGELHPSGDETLLTTRVVLSFDRHGGEPPFQVVVEDETGAAVFSLTTSETRIVVPPGILRPGRRFLWYVSDTLPDNTERRRSAVFRTLGASAARARRALVEQLSESREPSLVLLLEEIDRSLGLGRDSCRHLHQGPDLGRGTLAARGNLTPHAIEDGP